MAFQTRGFIDGKKTATIEITGIGIVSLPVR
jgi:hypothetical protein